MLDLNHLLLFIACVSPIVVLVRTWGDAAANRSWRASAMAVLVATALAYAIIPRSAGFVGGGAWLLWLFLPAVGLRRAAELASEQRFATAGLVLGVLRFLHPAATLRDERQLLRALELAQAGGTHAAEDILSKLAQGKTRTATQAAARLLRIRGDWEGLAAMCRQRLPGVGLGESADLLPLYLRALGESGARDEMVLQFAGRAPALLASPNHQPTFVASLMIVLAFCGRLAALASLFKQTLQRLPRDTKNFWIATSEAAAGEIAVSRATLERLRLSTSDALIRADCEQRLVRSPEFAPLSPPNEATVSRFERAATRRGGSLLVTRSRPLTRAVLILIGLNLAMFLAEIFLGGATNDLTLHRLGALEPAAVVSGGQYWRLLAALFLHYGPLHLLVNLYALYVLGPPLEAVIGARRFAFCYLLAGLGSSIGVVALWRFGVTKADFLVGASGAVMGIVGVWAGMLSRHRHIPMARRRLVTIGIIVLIQTTFDFLTPQISMAAHLSGLLSGFLIGLFIAPLREA